MNPNMYQYRPPIDLTNPRLRKLAAALGPAYVRVSGTWANSVYFADSDNPPAKAPAGFSGVLTRKEWKGVIDFVHAVEWRTRDFIRYERRHSQRARRVDSQRGQRLACVTQSPSEGKSLRPSS